MHFFSRLMREPISHFLLIGTLLFVVFAAMSDAEDTGADRNTVVVSDGEIEQLIEQFRQTWRRSPTADELDALVSAYVREEVLVREALSLSMEVGDPVIRRRLAQKMEFLIESGALAVTPNEEDIQEYYSHNSEAYAMGPKIALEHVYLGPSPSPEDVSELLAELRSGTPATELGERTLLPPSLGLSGRQAVDSTFGDGFFEALSKADPGTWVAPISSGYGYHAVRITDSVAALRPSLETVRTKVEADWRAAMAKDLTEAVFAEVEARYDISVPSGKELEDFLR